MARSLWKGPFVDGYLLKKAENVRSSGRNQAIKTWSRRSTILPQFVGLTFAVHNGNKHIPVLVSEEMSDTSSASSRRPGPFMAMAPTRVERTGDGQTEEQADGRHNEARAVTRLLRVSPRKLNDVATAIRGKKADSALADLTFRGGASRTTSRRHSNRRQCREQPRSTSTNWWWRSLCRKNMVMKRWSLRPWPGRQDREVLQPATIVVRQVEEIA